MQMRWVLVLLSCWGGLAAAASHPGTVRLGWQYTPTTSAPVTFAVERQVDCQGPWQRVQAPIAAATMPLSYVVDDCGVTVGQTYCWQVRIVAGTGASQASNTVGGLVIERRPTVCPPAPSGKERIE